ncbi:MAG: patatin-like phospholipase family protein [Planctomycetota bacterium]
MRKVGLALAGKSTHGLAHLGVLRFLEQRGWRPVALSGASMGAVIAAGYAAGLPLDDIAHRFAGFRFRRLLQPQWPSEGFSGHGRLIQELKNYLGDRTFTDTRIPLSIAATDFDSGQAYVFTSGSLWEACAAAVSIPVVFKPYPLSGQRLVDGGLLNNVPTTLLEGQGLDAIVATQLGLAREREGPVRGLGDAARQALEILYSSQSRINESRASLVIRPRVLNWNFLKFDAPELIRRGEEACQSVEAELKVLFGSYMAPT